MDADLNVLLPFLKAKGRFVSGASIARELGLSRVSVHNHLEALRKSGFTFSAVRNRGYRLETEPHPFHPVLYRALLEEDPCPFFKSVLTCGKVHSTNDIAEAELAGGRETPFLVIAGSQSAGRGRRGRTWHSPAGRNLYLSAALRPSLPPGRLQSITLWLGLRICQLLRDTLALPVLVKWPNDLMLHDRKVAGMLTEARVDSEVTRDLVFGLGLNVNTRAEDFPPELAGIAASLAMFRQEPLCISRLAHAITHRIGEAVSEYLEATFAPELARLWPEFDYLRGRMVATDTIAGVAAGITSTGSLRVEREDGSIALLHAGEVSLRKQ